MQVFDVIAQANELRSSGRLWAEVLRVPAMSAGIYRLSAGAEDPQGPHHEAEIYYVVGGRAVFEVNGERRSVGSGAAIFVEPEVEHRFRDVAEDLTLLVVFAPAET